MKISKISLILLGLFFSIFFSVFQSCNTEQSRKEAILDIISSAGDISPSILSAEDRALVADEYDFNEIEKTNTTNQQKRQQATNTKDIPTKNKAFRNRKLIKTGSISYETDEIEKSRKEIEKLVKKHYAFISNEESNNSSYRLEQSLSIRIPYENFDAFVSDLSGSVKKFDYKNINVKDVTEEYIDIQSRLKAKHKLEESYLVLLKKAFKIKDILEIEKELNNVRSDIESMEGRLRYLKDQVSLSTLNIVFYETQNVEYETEKGFFSKLWYNFQSGFGALQQIVLGVVSIWPVLLIIGGILFLFKRWWKKR